MNTKQLTIDLVLPGLLNLPLHELNSQTLAHSTPVLHQLLRYSNRVDNSVTDFDDIIIQRLDLNQRALPYAHAFNPDHSQHQLLLKPIHLKTDINNAFIFPVNLIKDELLLIINDLNNFFKEDYEIKYLSDNCWLMTLKSCQAVTEVPHYLSALGKKVTHYLEPAKTSLPWFKLFNEIQMFLYQHEINQQRQQNSLPTLNSLWCWGADHYQGEKMTNTRWFSDADEVRKIGDLYVGNSAMLDHINQTEINTDTVIIDLSVLKSLKGNRNSNIMALLESIENNYLKSLINHKLPIIVHTGGNINFHYQPISSFKFWKKNISLSDIIQQHQG